MENYSARSASLSASLCKGRFGQDMCYDLPGQKVAIFWYDLASTKGHRTPVLTPASTGSTGPPGSYGKLGPTMHFVGGMPCLLDPGIASFFDLG